MRPICLYLHADTDGRRHAADILPRLPPTVAVLLITDVASVKGSLAGCSGENLW